jgi:hypothetical protein
MERVVVAEEDASFVITDLAWAPSGRWIAVSGWKDLGVRTALRILDATDPSSFLHLVMDGGEATDLIASWRSSEP